MSQFEHPRFTDICKRFSFDEIIEKLTPMISEERIEKIDRVLSMRLPSVEIGVESPADVHNALAIVRSAEAFGVMQMHLVASQMKKRSGRKTTKGTSHWTDVAYHDSLQSMVGALNGRSICGAVVQGGIPVDQLDLSRPICLLFGNEQRGLTREALECCDQKFTIPMVGMVDSFNISVAAGIALYDVFRRRDEIEDRLHGQELLRARAYYIVKSMGEHYAARILNGMEK